MSLNLKSLLDEAHAELQKRHKYHAQHPSVSLESYIFYKRKQIADEHKNKKIIYYDTNAWKCISDYLRNKRSLTTEMRAFAILATNEEILEKCIFPIGLPTIFELESMTDPITISTLCSFIDKFSKNVSIVFGQDIIDLEFKLYKVRATCNRRELFFCRPFEMYGIPTTTLPGVASENGKNRTLRPAHSLSFG